MACGQHIVGQYMTYTLKAKPKISVCMPCSREWEAEDAARERALRDAIRATGDELLFAEVLDPDPKEFTEALAFIREVAPKRGVKLPKPWRLHVRAGAALLPALGAACTQAVQQKTQQGWAWGVYYVWTMYVRLLRLGRAVNPLLALLDHDIHGVRERAAWALGQIKNHRAVEPLGRVLLQDEIAFVRRTAAKALGRLKDPRALALLDTARQDEDDYVRLAVRVALDDLLDRQVVEPLLAGLAGQDEGVRAAAWRALRVLDSSVHGLGSSFPLYIAIQHALGPDWKQSEAVRKTVPALIAALHDPDAWVRGSVATLLWYLRPANTAALLALKQVTQQDPDPEVRAAAWRALGTLAKSDTAR